MDWTTARFEYETDCTVTQAQLAEQLGVTHQAVSKRVKKEGWTKAVDHTEVAEQLPTVEPRAGSELGKRSPENLSQIINVYALTGNKTLASGAAGISRETLRNWCLEDHELLAQMSYQRKMFLAGQFEKISKAKDWKAAKEILARSPETRDEWAEKQKESPTIILNIQRD